MEVDGVGRMTVMTISQMPNSVVPSTSMFSRSATSFSCQSSPQSQGHGCRSCGGRPSCTSAHTAQCTPIAAAKSRIAFSSTLFSERLTPFGTLTRFMSATMVPPLIQTKKPSKNRSNCSWNPVDWYVPRLPNPVFQSPPSWVACRHRPNHTCRTRDAARCHLSHPVAWLGIGPKIGRTGRTMSGTMDTP